MNLNELKSMIAKEYKSYMAEQAAATPSVDVDATDVDATGGDENPEETLRDIYDMLKDYGMLFWHQQMQMKKQKQH